LEDFVILVKFANIVNSLKDPLTLIKTLTRDDVQNWKVVVEEEMSFLRKTMHGYCQSF
jgi:hypothetical protein